MTKLKLATLYEGLQQIDKFKTDLEIEIDLGKTDHASERQTRHGSSDIISDDEIKENVRSAKDRIVRSLVFNNIDVGDYVVITNKQTNLNCVCVIDKKYPGLPVRVITVMRKQDFKTDNSGTYRIYV